MNKRLKELAKQAGFDSEAQTVYAFDYFDLERFAELIRQDEREVCAKLCEEGIIGDNSRNDYERMNCASVIRARSKE